MACARGLTDRDRNIRDQVKLYRRLIEEIIDPKQMLSSPEGFTLEQCLGGVNVQQIKKRQVSDGHLSAAQLMFDKMEQCEDNGVWTAFDDLLQNAGYERISSILRGEPARNENHNTQLIKVIGPAVTHKIDPVVLLPQLLRKALSKEDSQNIRAEATNKGKISATVLMFDALLRSKTLDWFDDFMRALIENQQLNVVDEIDPDFYQKFYYEENNLDRRNLKAAKLLSKDVTEDVEPSSDLPLNVGGEAQESNTDSVLGEMASCVTDDNTTPKQILVDESNMLGLTSDEDYGVKQRKPMKGRSYQEELAEAGLEGKNCMIVAPSGKTQVALKIIEKHLLASHEIRKVAFLVNTVALAEEHFRSCKNLLLAGMRRRLITDVNEKLDLLLQDSDVFVMTVQILVEALAFDEIRRLSEFTLIVFDECHNTLGKDPYNVIMSAYLDEKLREGGPRWPLPQIIGLTASTGVGKAKGITQAKEHIEKLCANLDVEKICTVKRCLRDLSEVFNIPDVETHLFGGRREDRFADFVQDWMINIESKIKDHCRHWTKLEDPPGGKRDCLEYKQWIGRVTETVVKRPDSQHYCMSCIRFLEICNSALIINQNVRTRDALNHMTEQMQQMNPSTFTNVERELYSLFKGNAANLQSICENPASTNPKLEKMKKMILSVFHNNADSRVIIFAKFRDLAQALQRWMTETPGLSDLNPQKLVGQGAEEDGGMSQAKQGEVRTGFREGSHKVIVATSVAEEGLDIQKCNLVIFYDYDTNEISKVPTRGRARAEDCRWVLFVSEDKGIAEKDEVNSMGEILMENALWDLQEEIEEDPGRFVDAVRNIQNTCKEERNLARLMERKRQFIEGTFELRCRKCDRFACFNYDIRKFESTHRAVIAVDFCTRVKISRHPTKYRVAEKGKLWCEKCGLEWGIVACYRSKNLFVIKIDSFVVVDHKERRRTFEKWSDIRFEVEHVRHTDRDCLNTVSNFIAAKLAKLRSRCRIT